MCSQLTVKVHFASRKRKKVHFNLWTVITLLKEVKVIPTVPLAFTLRREKERKKLFIYGVQIFGRNDNCYIRFFLFASRFSLTILFA